MKRQTSPVSRTQFTYSARVNTGLVKLDGSVDTVFTPREFLETSMQIAKAFVRGLLTVEGDWKVCLTVDGEYVEWVCEVCVMDDGMIFRHDHAA